MSKFQNIATNQKRVEKMCETLRLLAVSAESNRAGPEDWAELMQPFNEQLEEVSRVPLPEAPKFQAPPVSVEEALGYNAIPKLVASIPEDLLPNVLAQVAARICELPYQRSTDE